MSSAASDYTVEILSGRHDRSAFFCGVDALDRYLRQQAGQDVRRHIGSLASDRRCDLHPGDALAPAHSW